MDKFEVIVGNIGTVYSGNNFMVASSKYNTYVKQAKAHHGRAAGEDVVLMHCGHVRLEHVGYMKRDTAEHDVLDPSNGGQF